MMVFLIIRMNVPMPKVSPAQKVVRIKDADGIADREDRCPDVAGPAASKGCRDKDGDGIVDIDDKCQDTDKKYKVDSNGCPLDNDKDGVLNEDDLCPDVKGIASLKGCTDTDGDGVADPDDRGPCRKRNHRQ